MRVEVEDADRALARLDILAIQPSYQLLGEDSHRRVIAALVVRLLLLTAGSHDDAALAGAQQCPRHILEHALTGLLFVTEHAGRHRTRVAGVEHEQHAPSRDGFDLLEQFVLAHAALIDDLALGHLGIVGGKIVGPVLVVVTVAGVEQEDSVGGLQRGQLIQRVEDCPARRSFTG